MTAPDELDRRLAEWMTETASSPPAAGRFEQAVDATARRRRRPRWMATLGSDWVGATGNVGSSSGLRTLPRSGLRWSIALIVLLVIAALVGGAILVGARLVQPSPLPASRLGHLAYGLDGGIYVAGEDGTNPVRIAVGRPGGTSGCGPAGYWGEGPMWSPDGRYLAYRSGFDQVSCPSLPGTVFISDPAGHMVTSFPGNGWLVSWSPDSTRIATWVDLDKTIGIYGLDGVRQALITVPSGGLPGDFDPIWSADGASLRLPGLAALPVDGRAPESSVGQGWPLGATFSPDGRISYISGDIFVVKASDGSQPRSLLEGANLSGNFVWSSTGDRIAYGVQTGVGTGNLGPETALDMLDVASGAVTPLAGRGGTDSLSAIRFSPQGDQVLYSRTDATGTSSLWSVHADGSDPHLLVKGTTWGDWQPQPAVVDPSPVATPSPTATGSTGRPTPHLLTGVATTPRNDLCAGATRLADIWDTSVAGNEMNHWIGSDLHPLNALGSGGVAIIVPVPGGATEVRLLDPLTSRSCLLLELPGGGTVQLANWSPSGDALAIALSDQSVYVWSAMGTTRPMALGGDKECPPEWWELSEAPDLR